MYTFGFILHFHVYRRGTAGSKKTYAFKRWHKNAGDWYPSSACPHLDLEQIGVDATVGQSSNENAMNTHIVNLTPFCFWPQNIKCQLLTLPCIKLFILDTRICLFIHLHRHFLQCLKITCLCSNEGSKAFDFCLNQQLHILQRYTGQQKKNLYCRFWPWLFLSPFFVCSLSTVNEQIICMTKKKKKQPRFLNTFISWEQTWFECDENFG